MNWNNNKVMVYPMGLSGQYSLSIDHSRISHFEILHNNQHRLIECDIEEKWMKVKEKNTSLSDWNEINLNELKKDDIVDLSDRGDRWEGTSVQGNPFGYGCIYDDENRLIYNGFIYKGMKVCFGCVFYGDTSTIEYCGCFYKNQRHGYGKLCDKIGNVVYKGDWFKDKPIILSTLTIDKELNESDIQFDIEVLIITNECKSDLECFKLLRFNHLKRIEIGDESFDKVRMFEINTCPKLEECIIKDWSFCNSTCFSLLSITISILITNRSSFSHYLLYW